MPRTSGGVYQAPASDVSPPVSGTTIDPIAFNNLEVDIGNEITNSLDRQGRAPMLAALPMGGFKVTGGADPTSATDLATKNYVDTTTAAFFSTGDVKLTIKTTPDAGWLMCNDTSIGNTTSGATYANVAAQALFLVLWNNVYDAYAPVTGGRGASAAADWSAQKPIALTKMLGRALGVSGAGSGLVTRLLGQALGAETSTIAITHLPTGALGDTQTQGINAQTQLGSGVFGAAAGSGNALGYHADVNITIPSVAMISRGSGTALPIMPPISFLNAMIKL